MENSQSPRPPATDHQGGSSAEAWKQDLRRRFDQWLAQLDDSPEPDDTERPAPDLYSFYQVLSALGSDVRKGTRRSQDTLVRFGETLERFEQTLQAMADRLSRDRQNQSHLASAEQRVFLMPYAELLERLLRFEARLAQPPRTGMLNARKEWSRAWSTLREGFVLLREHFQALLSQAGVEKMNTLGQLFDPARMKAVAVEASPTAPPNTVVEELAGGYFHRGEILKFAEVKIAIQKGER
jgi:molecular chaperone GrpE (heat shock protein)